MFYGTILCHNHRTMLICQQVAKKKLWLTAVSTEGLSIFITALYGQLQAFFCSVGKAVKYPFHTYGQGGLTPE